MTTVDVELPGTPPHSYRVRVGTRLPDDAAERLLELAAPPRWAVVADSGVDVLYAGPLVASLGRRGATAECTTFAAGEASKNRETVADLQDRLIAAGHGRDSWLVAVGGGVVGDVAGFVAATLFRGVPYVQVPTTLLAMVDSSVGGKTGVDTPLGKNLVGAIWQPRAVLIDVRTLETLPDAELDAGLAEVIKYGVILDAELFASLEAGMATAARQRSAAELEELVARCCRLKADIVAADEREADLRQILNFGHTVAHAVEAILSYDIRHGEAVAIGMVAEARLAAKLCDAPAGLHRRIADLCAAVGLPTSLPPGCSPEAVVEAAYHDKKVRGGELRCALPAELGRMATGPHGYGLPVEPGALRAALQE